MLTGTKAKINDICDNMKDLLFYKNEKYGDAALSPINIFSKNDSGNSLCVRIDDKLSRIKNGKELKKNDVCDLMGYLILLSADKNWIDFSEFKD